MEKDVTLGAIFPEKYSNIIYRYVEMVNDIIKEYDAVIFMARKSICFYNSLIIQGEIEKADNCCIMSSRALEYNVLDRFRNKRVAIVDDVVVKGISITKAIENLKVYGIKPDIYIAACEKDFIDNAFEDYKDYIKMPYMILNQIDICEFATYITKYIETSGCPYNIDQPIYKIFFEKVQDIEKFFEDNNYVDITSKSQKEFGIISRVVHFESQFLSEVLPKELDLNDVYIKIRVIHIEGSLELIMLPFILLPPISYDLLNNLYSLIQCAELEQIIEKNNERSMYENKLNIFQYVFSNILIIKYLENVDCIVSKKVYSNEIAQFSKCLLNKDKLLLLTEDLFKDKSLGLLQKNVYKDIFLLNDYLSKAYDLVLTKNFPKVFENSQGSMIQSKVITITLLEQYIRQQCNKFDPYTLSNLVDIFIDRGIFVPTVVHYQENKGIVRAYKGGEVAKITALEMELFVYMLAGYLDNIDRDYLDKTEFEKLCVLFFRCAITKAVFPNISNNKEKANDEDAYEISYAKFGPRVSVAEGERYEAGEKHLLADELIDLDLLGKCKRQNAQGELKEKYYVKDCKKKI